MSNRYVFSLGLGLMLATAASGQEAVDFRDAAKQSFPATVGIETESTALPNRTITTNNRRSMLRFRISEVAEPLRYSYFASGENQPQSASGVVVGPDLVIARCAGKSADQVQLRLNDGKLSAATIIAIDFVTGFSALRSPGLNVKPLAISDQALQPGQPLFASRRDGSGDPIGQVVMVNNHRTSAMPQFGFVNCISGQSMEIFDGAPLVDEQGTLVGMTRSTSEGLIAIPMANFKRLIEAVNSETPHDLFAGRIGLKFENGNDAPIVKEVIAGFPAEKSGIAANDEVLEVNGLETKKVSDVMAAVAMSRGGDTIPLKLKRGQESLTVDLTLESDASDTDAVPAATRATSQQGPYIWQNGQLVPMTDNVPPVDQSALDRINETIQQAMPKNDLHLSFAPQIQGLQVERSELEANIRELESRLNELRAEQNKLSKWLQSQRKEFRPKSDELNPSRAEGLLDELRKENDELKAAKSTRP